MTTVYRAKMTKAERAAYRLDAQLAHYMGLMMAAMVAR